MIDEKRLGILQTAILHCENELSRRAAQTTEAIKNLGFEVLDHHSYSQDLGPL